MIFVSLKFSYRDGRKLRGSKDKSIIFVAPKSLKYKIIIHPMESKDLGGLKLKGERIGLPRGIKDKKRFKCGQEIGNDKLTIF